MDRPTSAPSAEAEDSLVRQQSARVAPNKQIKITEKAINKIVGQAIRSVPGVIAIDGGMEKVTGRSYPRYDLALDDDGDAVSIDAQIAVGWPAPVADVAAAVRETIITWVSDMTDVPVSHANVTVGVVEPGHERTTSAQLAAFNPHPVLDPIHVTAVEPKVGIVTTPGVAQVRSISAPEPAKLVEFSAGNAPMIVSPTVAQQRSLADITVSEQVSLSPVEVVDSHELAPIEVAAPVELSPIRVTESRELTPITVSSSASLTPVDIADEKPLTPVSQQPSLPEVKVTVAPAKKLTPVTITPTSLTSVAAPPPVPVARVVEPTSHRLAEVTTTRKPIKRVQDPTPHRLATVSVPEDRRVTRPKAPQPARLQRVVTKGIRVQQTPAVSPAPLTKTGVPAAKPLRPIVVRSPELKTIKVVTKK